MPKLSETQREDIMAVTGQRDEDIDYSDIPPIRNVINMEVAQRIYDLRTKAGLTQRALAKSWNRRSAICRLEDADYDGHSHSIVKRIVEALNKRVEIRFVPISKTARASGSGANSGELRSPATAGVRSRQARVPAPRAPI
jgi:hypothetical protein